MKLSVTRNLIAQPRMEHKTAPVLQFSVKLTFQAESESYASFIVSKLHQAVVAICPAFFLRVSHTPHGVNHIGTNYSPNPPFYSAESDRCDPDITCYVLVCKALGKFAPVDLPPFVMLFTIMIMILLNQ